MQAGLDEPKQGSMAAIAFIDYILFECWVCSGSAAQSFPIISSNCPPFPPFFCLSVGDPQEGRGDVAIHPHMWAPKTVGIRWSGLEEGVMFGGKALG